METPNLDKISANEETIKLLSEFGDWMADQGVIFVRGDGTSADQSVVFIEYIGADPKVAEEERQALLAEIRLMNMAREMSSE